MPVIETKIHFFAPAFYDELLVIETRVEKLPTVKVHIDHIIKAKERDVVICEGYVELAFLDAKTNRPTRAPQIFIDAVKKYCTESDFDMAIIIRTTERDPYLIEIWLVDTKFVEDIQFFKVEADYNILTKTIKEEVRTILSEYVSNH